MYALAFLCFALAASWAVVAAYRLGQVTGRQRSIERAGW